MQISNNSQMSFKSGSVTYAAEQAIKRRMPLNKARALKERFVKLYKNSDFDIELNTISFGGSWLNAMIKYKGQFKRYVEESLLGIFRSPESFVNEVNNVVEKEIIPSLNRTF